MADQGPAGQVKPTKELKGLMSDVGKIYSEIRKLGKDNLGVLDKQVKQARDLMIIQKLALKGEELTVEKSKEMKKNMEEMLKIGNQNVGIQQSFKDSAEQSSNKWSDMKNQAAGFAGTLWGIVTSPMALMIAAAVFLGKMFVDWNKRGEEFRQTTGIVGEQFNKLNAQAMGIAAELGHLGISQKEALEYTQALTEEFGSIEFISRKLVKNTAILSVTMGIGADEATKMMSSFMTITAGSEEMATNMIKFTSTLSESAGVARNMVMKDIADNAESLAGYMKDSGANIVEAAVQARQLGVSISTVVGAADKLLEFESSIEAQMNAQVLTGRQINTERARMLAISGDLAGLQREILDQVGSQTEFEEMNVIQRRALAEAFGMGVGELGKMISRQETLHKLTTGQIDAAKAMAQGMSLTEILGTNDKVMSGLTQLTNIVVKLANVASTVLLPVFVVLSDVLSVVATGINWIIDLLPDMSKNADSSGKAWIMFAVYVGVATAAVVLFRIAMRKLTGTKLGGFLKGLRGGAAKGGGIFGNLFGGLSWGAIAKGAALMIVLGGALWILGKALATFNDVDWPSLGKAALAIIGLMAAMAGLGAIMASGIGAIAIWAGIAVFAALAATLYILGEAIKSMGTGFTFISTSMETIASLSIPDFSSWDGLIDRVALLSQFAEPLGKVADSVTAISAVTAGAGIAEAAVATTAAGTFVGGTEVNVSLDDVVKKLDDIELMFQNGVDLKLNGAKIGEWLGKEVRKA